MNQIFRVQLVSTILLAFGSRSFVRTHNKVKRAPFLAVQSILAMLSVMFSYKFYSYVFLCSFAANVPPTLEDTEATIASCKAAGQWQFAVLLLSEVTARRLQTDVACLAAAKVVYTWHLLVAHVFVWFMFGSYLHLLPHDGIDIIPENHKEQQTKPNCYRNHY